MSESCSLAFLSTLYRMGTRHTELHKSVIGGAQLKWIPLILSLDCQHCLGSQLITHCTPTWVRVRDHLVINSNNRLAKMVLNLFTQQKGNGESVNVKPVNATSLAALCRRGFANHRIIAHRDTQFCMNMIITIIINITLMPLWLSFSVLSSASTSTSTSIYSSGSCLCLSWVLSTCFGVLRDVAASMATSKLNSSCK